MNWNHNGNQQQIIRRPKEWNNAVFLYYLYNDLGHEKLRITHNYVTEDGDIGFTKWYKYYDLMHVAPHESPEGTFHTRRELIEKATHRTLLEYEVMLDIDEPSPDHATIRETSIAVCRKLRNYAIQHIVHFTGNKSYHISFLMPKVRRKMGKRRRERFLSWLLSDVFHADPQKFTSNHMISLEGAPHYRSKKPKKEVVLLE